MPMCVELSKYESGSVLRDRDFGTLCRGFCCDFKYGQRTINQFNINLKKLVA